MTEPTSQTRTLVIRNKLGMHARAAVKFVQAAGKFDVDVWVAKAPDASDPSASTEEVNGKSIMGLLTLVAAMGTSIRLRVSGKEADAAMQALGSLIERGFDEGVDLHA